MATDTECLDQANACHDADPARGAELLRAINASQLPSDRWPSYAFLLNHVLGEKLGLWDAALQRQQALLKIARPAPAAVLWRQAATAARVAGATKLAAEMIQAFADASGASVERSAEVVQLSAAMYRAPGLSAAQAAEHALAVLAPLNLPAWQAPNPLDAAVAACTNNIASTFLERPAADLQLPAARAALAQSAEQAERFWQRAGTWVHHERALYQRAMASQALGEPAAARQHAMNALALIDGNDRDHAEDVDRAFIELERWCACERLGLANEAAEARAQAGALAAKFDDAGLTTWFERRRQTLKAMLAD